jgi:hypothetical protein
VYCPAPTECLSTACRRTIARTTRMTDTAANTNTQAAIKEKFDPMPPEFLRRAVETSASLDDDKSTSAPEHPNT